MKVSTTKICHLFLRVEQETRIDFAVAVSSRAVRIPSTEGRTRFSGPITSTRPSYGTFSLMVLQGN